MKHLLPGSFLLAAAFAAASCTQAAPEQAAAPAAATTAASEAPTGSEDVQAVITQLERDWVQAIVKKDTATVDRLLAREFNGTSPTGDTFGKAQAIEDMKSEKYVAESMDLEEISVNSFGNMAVAFTSQVEKSHYGSQDTSGRYRYTDVWVKKDGTWQAVASHGSRLGKPN